MSTTPLSPLLFSQGMAPSPEPPAPAGTTSNARSMFERGVLGVTLLAAAAAFYPLVSQHLRMLWQTEEYQHATLILAAVGFLIWRRWPDKGDTRYQATPRPVGLLVGLIGLLAAVVLNSPPLAMLAAVPAVFSAVCSWSRVVETRRFWGPCLLLLLLVPLPYFVQAELIEALKGWTTQAAGRILDLLGIDHQLLGFTIAVPNRWFFVDQACSGVNSLFGMISLALVLAVWSRLPIVVALNLIPAAFLGVLLVNILRMVVIVTAHAWYGLDLASGTPHQLLGLALLPLTLIVVVGFVSWTQWLLAPIGAFGDSPLTDLWDRVLHGGRLPDDDFELDPVSPTQPLFVGMQPEESPPGGRATGIWLLSFCLAGCAVYGQYWLLFANANSARTSLPLVALNEQSLPASIFDWQRIEFREVERKQQDPQGQHSRLWRYQHSQMDRALLVSVDSPFPGWHELTACYRATGWTIQERKVSGGQGKPFVVRVAMKDGTGATAWMWFALVDVSGKTLEPPQQHWSATLMNQVRIAVNQFGKDTTTRQVQLIVPGGRELRADELTQLEQKFREFIPKLAPKIVEDGQEKVQRSERQ